MENVSSEFTMLMYSVRDAIEDQGSWAVQFIPFVGTTFFIIMHIKLELYL